MSDLLWTPLIGLPIILAALAGAVTSQRSRAIQFLALIFITAYPMAHWFLLRLIRETFLNLDIESRVVAGQLSALLMTAEFVICPLAFLSAFAIRSALTRRTKA